MVEFLISQKNYHKIERKNEININIFGYKNKQTYPIHLWKENYKDQIQLLLLKNKDKSHHIYIKSFNILKHKKENLKKNWTNCLQCFNSNKVLIAYQEVSSKINGMRSIQMPKRGGPKNLLIFTNSWLLL